MKKYQKLNAKQKDLVPFLSPQLATKDRSTPPELEGDATITGLKPHLSLRELTSNPVGESKDFRMQNRSLNAPSTANTLTVTELLGSSKRSNPKKKTLIEYKDYSHVGDLDSCEVGDLPQWGSKKSIHQLASLLASSGKYDLYTLPFKGYINQKTMDA